MEGQKNAAEKNNELLKILASRRMELEYLDNEVVTRGERVKSFMETILKEDVWAWGETIPEKIGDDMLFIGRAIGVRQSVLDDVGIIMERMEENQKKGKGA